MPARQRLLRVLAALLLLGRSICAQEFSGETVSVTDGDTIAVLWGRLSMRIRLYGIDAPERNQPYYARARQLAAELAFRKTVTVRVRDVDSYGRLVAEVVLPDGRILNRELVAAGLAWWYRQYAPDDRQLAELEAQARAARRGLWSLPAPVAPWDWRASKRKPQQRP